MVQNLHTQVGNPQFKAACKFVEELIETLKLTPTHYVADTVEL